MDKKLLEKEISEKMKKYFPELGVGKEAKIVNKRYVKYKQGGHWRRLPITNFDEDRNFSLRVIKQILENLFEKVELVRMRVPFVYSTNTGLYTLSKSFEDKVLLSTRLKPIFELRYKGIDYETARMINVYLGRSYVFYYYWDEKSTEQVIDELLKDVKYLHVHSFVNRIIDRKLNELIFSYYSDIFPKILPPPTLPEAKTPELKVEKPTEKIEVQKTEEVEKEQAKRKVEEKAYKPEIFSIDYEKEDKNEIQKTISEYRPQAANFFGVVAKTKYESLIKQMKDEDKKNKVDYLFYQFIKLSGDLATKELYSQFLKKLEEVTLDLSLK